MDIDQVRAAYKDVDQIAQEAADAEYIKVIEWCKEAAAMGCARIEYDTCPRYALNHLVAKLKENGFDAWWHKAHTKQYVVTAMGWDKPKPEIFNLSSPNGSFSISAPTNTNKLW